MVPQVLWYLYHSHAISPNFRWNVFKFNYHGTMGITVNKGRLWSYGSQIYNYLCNQCLSPLKFESCSWRGVLDTTLCDKVCQWLVARRWLSPGTPVYSTNKSDRHDITEILLKVALNTITLNLTLLLKSFFYQMKFLLVSDWPVNITKRLDDITSVCHSFTVVFVISSNLLLFIFQ
jgi:hypothetical protein